MLSSEVADFAKENLGIVLQHVSDRDLGPINTDQQRRDVHDMPHGCYIF